MSRVVDERVDFDVLSIDSLDISVGLTLDPLGWTMDFISSPHPPFALKLQKLPIFPIHSQEKGKNKSSNIFASLELIVVVLVMIRYRTTYITFNTAARFLFVKWEFNFTSTFFFVLEHAMEGN
ncbi:hypothetical protein Fcan01_28426 [Folsomia candida]|uniref:Uncharacterized protein n=1 Tax=Folsomia candida TaxID=158441 RepID=A0A226CUY7_FOLCA|nr:hypothetical protein Fcan01_28426 [Folsomia candida]